ncbi:MAG: serine/threonine-protein kinase [Planctomycetota bacterium]
MDGLTKQEILFAKQIIALGFNTRDSVERSIRSLRDARRSGATTNLNLAQQMVSDGIVSHEQARAAINRISGAFDPSLASPPQQQAPSQVVIPGYELEDILRVDLNGAVYRARQVSMDRLVAIKVLRNDWLSSPTKIRTFITEAQTAGKLNHPNVIRILEVNHVNSLYYYSSEYVDGFSLPVLLSKLESRRLSARASCIIFAQVARAIEYGASIGVLHREIRPDVVYVGSNNITKVANFGLVGNEETRFLEGNNPFYVAPELVEKQPTTLLSDIYSLGATMYYALTGTAPFVEADRPRRILARRLSHPPQPIRSLVPDLPSPLVTLIVLLMGRQPKWRPHSPGDIAAELERMAEGDFTESEWLADQKRQADDQRSGRRKPSDGAQRQSEATRKRTKSDPIKKRSTDIALPPKPPKSGRLR